MSVRSDISQEDGWFRFEEKTLSFTITNEDGDPIDLMGLSLQWRILRDANSSTIFFETTAIAISGASNNVANITLLASDYDDLPAGIWHHALWDMDNDLLLSYGDVWLHTAADPAAV